MTTLHLIVAYARNGVSSNDGSIPWYLPVGLNVVVTSPPDYVAASVAVVDSIEWAQEVVKDHPVAFIMGCAQIYRQTVDRVQVAHITVINADYDGDAYFDAFEAKDWRLVDESTFSATDQHPWSFAIKRYECL